MLPSLPPEVLPAALITVFAALLAGLARGFSGFGAAMVFVPLASATLGPVVAVPVLLIADLLVALPVIAKATRVCSWPDVRAVAIGGIIGLPIGNQILTATDPVAVRWAVTVLILACLVLMVGGWRMPGAGRPTATGAVGLVSGLMSGLAQIGGPPVVVYWLSMAMETVRMRASLIVYFAILMWLSLLLFVARGLLGPTVLWLGLLAAPGYAIGIWLGTASFGLASPTTFRRIAIALVALSTLLGMPVLDPWLR
jgi:uncharacterized membrane protein YfcA